MKNRRAFYISLGCVFLTLTYVYEPLLLQTYFTQGQSLGGNTSSLLLLMALGLFLYRLSLVLVMPNKASWMVGWLFLGLGSAMFLLGSLLLLPMLTIGSMIPVLAAVVLIYFGRLAFQQVMFPLALLFFVIPLPYMMTDFIVQPLKLFISHMTEWILYKAGYPVARNGVILIIGDYQLLIADACSGINSLFSLEAIGWLYLHIKSKKSVIRNWIIGFLIIPVSIISNITRVLVLALLTYYFGNDAGQSFLHDLSGFLLFIVALFIIVFIDRLIDRLLPVVSRQLSGRANSKWGEGVGHENE